MKSISRIKKKELNKRKPVSMMEFYKQVRQIAGKDNGLVSVKVDIKQHYSNGSLLKFEHKYGCYYHGGNWAEGKTPQEAIDKMKIQIGEIKTGSPTPIDAIVDDLPF